MGFYMVLVLLATLGELAFATDLVWDAPYCPCTTGYNIYRASNVKGDFGRLELLAFVPQPVPSNPLTYTDPEGTANGPRYKYVATAVYGGVETGLSNVAWDGVNHLVSVEVKERVVLYGGTITVSWVDTRDAVNPLPVSGVPTPNDWIAVHTVGAAPSAYRSWFYRNCTKTPPEQPILSGTCTFAVTQPQFPQEPAEIPGRYNVLMHNNDQYYPVAVSEAFDLRVP